MPFKNTYTTFDDVECGLVSVHNNFVLPLYLEQCSVDIEVVNHIGEYVITQTYVNLTDDAIEALYIFPIQEGGAVHFFTAESNGKVVTSIVKEKDQSDASYVDEDELAMDDNRTTFLISEFKPDIYQLALGELEPNSITKIELRYVCELPTENSAVKLVIPSTVAPQYGVPDNECEEKTAASQLVDTDKDIDIKLTVKLRQTVAFKQLCESHEIEFADGNIAYEDGLFYSSGMLNISRTKFDEEIIIYVRTVSGSSFGARILLEETSKGEVAAMVTLVPEFPAVDFQAEMIFLVDRSGSMMGRSIEKAKEALQIFLASLPSDCKFNICSFNASFDFLFEESLPYNDENLTRARQYVDDMQAGGGTRVYEPLETIFKTHVEEGCQRQIFVLTDGHVARPGESTKMVRNYTKQGRVFSLGIGEGASRELVNGLAEAGNGLAVFVTLAEDLKDKVLELLSSSLLSGLSNISFDWLSDMKPQSASTADTVMKLKETSAPPKVPHVFSTRLLIVYQSLESGNLPVALRISGTGPKGDVMLIVTLDSTKVMKSELLHKLMARRMVKMLEEADDNSLEDAMQQRMTQLGVDYNISNKWCSSTTTDQFGAKKAAESTSRAEVPPPPSFQPAPHGLVSQSSPLNSSGLSFFKKKTKSYGSSKASPAMLKGTLRGPGGSSKSLVTEQVRYQISNTRMAKSKNMSSAPQSRVYNMAPNAGFSACPSPMQQNDAYADSAYSKSVLKDDMLMNFTKLQKSDGSYMYGPAFLNELNMTEDDIVNGAVEFSVSRELLQTLVVIIFLRSVMANRKSSWSRMGSKADEFIAANLGNHDLPKLEAECEKFIDRYIMQSRSAAVFKGYKKRSKF